MCKHVAAALYGVGARLDAKPELLFVLREVDHLALIASATSARTPATKGTKAGKGTKASKVIAKGDLASVFGIELDTGGASESEPEAPPPKRAPKRAAKGAGRKR